MVKVKQQRRRNRKLPDKAVPPPLAFTTIVSVTAGTLQVTVLFASPVQIAANNLPASWVFGTANRKITTLASSTPTSYVFNVDGSVAAAQAYNCPVDPSARTPSGGYVAAKAANMV